ncbi:MAG: hypothetical protein PHU85_03380 [Phycisphaerae bacterium]|nr:hypothetical protein [Phycisphaerae bacterium]
MPQCRMRFEGMKSCINAALPILFLLIAPLRADEPGSAGLPMNKWVKLPATSQPGYLWSAPVYVPARGQVLFWGSAHAATGGAVGFLSGTSRNDVVAFDAAALAWASDYPSDEKAPVGIAGVGGVGAMLPSGRPRPAHVMQGVCYDSKRGQVIYTMKGLMAAYDPGAKTWKDLGARTVMSDGGGQPASGQAAPAPVEYPGGPPVYAIGTCYDPVNDEILLFPHFDAKNIALRQATGQISGHYGTFRYSFKDNLWRQAGDTLGTEQTRKARADLLAAMAKVSNAMDAAWRLNRRPDPVAAAEAARQLEAAVEAAGDQRTPVAERLKAAGAALAAGKPGDALQPLRDSLWAMNAILDTTLRIEPPARCGAPMAYDAKNQLIVMFGGHTNLARTDLPPGTPNVQSYETGLNDTWVYDCKSRQWRELACANRPPAGTLVSKMPMLAYDPASGLIVLVSLTTSGRPPRQECKAVLWTLDAAKGEWLQRDTQDWPGRLAVVGSGGGSSYPGAEMPTSVLALDEKAKLLLIVQREKSGSDTCAMRLDVGKLPTAPAPTWAAPPPIRPQEVPGEDPAWVARLKDLPANTWVRAKPKQEAKRRDWGNLSVDPVRGWVVYFGGGHSTWQVNDVAVYSVGANAWAPAVGDFNSYITPQGWEGSTLGYRGGPACGHQRNAYQSFDGRMYLLVGTDENPSAGRSLWSPWNFTFHAERDFVRFYDIDRGGVWRETRIATIERPEKVPYQTNVNLADPAGRLINLIRTGGGDSARMFAAVYDVGPDKLTVREVPAPLPPVWEIGESRPFCYVAGEGSVFYMSAKPDQAATAPQGGKRPMKQATYLYDVGKNAFRELRPAHTPPAASVRVVEYVDSQKCAWAIVGDQQWVYSFERNDWAQMPLVVEGGGMWFQTPYGQMVWVARYGVFVNLGGGTWIMRPECGRAFDAARVPATRPDK